MESKYEKALGGVFDADTMHHWWQNMNNPERIIYGRKK
jgi:hypothetical protein